MMKPALARSDGRTVPLAPKQADPLYTSGGYKVWREAIIARAGRRCEAIDDGGARCTKAEPQHRMFADHIEEVQDNPARRFDLSNGQCLCGKHHTLKTNRERSNRFDAGSRRAGG